MKKVTDKKLFAEMLADLKLALMHLEACPTHTAPYIASVIRKTIAKAEGKPPSDEDRANTNLIAAAPEMLEALRKIESCLAPEDNDVAAAAVRSAIRKAEGK